MKHKQNTDSTLLIMAAGMGSRYGGLKQMEGVGASGETIMEYSIYDAIRAGFGKVVFVVRESFLQQFKSIFDKKLQGKIEVYYVTQEIFKIPKSTVFNKERQKPWGTAHAVWVARNCIDTNFAVINADDFYGYDAFIKIHYFLSQQCDFMTYAMVGYKLSNTISKHGGVSRGICNLKDDYLHDIAEHHQIKKSNNSIISIYKNKSKELPLTSITSMNFWGFSPDIFNHLSMRFEAFLKLEGKSLTSEFYIPTVVDISLKLKFIKVKVLKTDARWHGVTYKEDKPIVVNALQEYVKSGLYPSNLWA